MHFTPLIHSFRISISSWFPPGRVFEIRHLKEPSRSQLNLIITDSSQDCVNYWVCPTVLTCGRDEGRCPKWPLDSTPVIIRADENGRRGKDTHWTRNHKTCDSSQSGTELTLNSDPQSWRYLWNQKGLGSNPCLRAGSLQQPRNFFICDGRVALPIFQEQKRNKHWYYKGPQLLPAWDRHSQAPEF